MPWEKQFDVEEALERAMHTFWAQGYEATSMDVLLRRMGINRGSFYATFRSKRHVLIRALQRYDARNRDAVMRGIAEGRSPRKAVSMIFRGLTDGSRFPQGRHGCFLVNAALEMAPKDKEVARIVRQGFSELEKFFAELVREAQKTGEVRKGVNAAATGRALMNQLVGLMVLVRSKAPQAVLDSVVKQAEQMMA